LRNEEINKYKLPWLNIGKKFNWKLLGKNQPSNIWFREEYIIGILKNSGFSIVEVKNRLSSSDKIGHIHIVCKKSPL
jgi:hypothetical protein